jgi:hypothetical protein
MRSARSTSRCGRGQLAMADPTPPQKGAVKHWLCVMFEDNSQLATSRAEEIGFHGIAVADRCHPHGLRGAPSGENRSSRPPTSRPVHHHRGDGCGLASHFFLRVVLPARDPSASRQRYGRILNGRFASAQAGSRIALLGHDPASAGNGWTNDPDPPRLPGTTAPPSSRRVLRFRADSMYPKPSGHVPVWVGGKSDAALGAHATTLARRTTHSTRSMCCCGSPTNASESRTSVEMTTGRDDGHPNATVASSTTTWRPRASPHRPLAWRWVIRRCVARRNGRWLPTQRSTVAAGRS